MVLTETAAASPLDMPVAEFRQYGGEVMDWIAGYLDNPRAHPVLSNYLPGELKSSLPASGPEYGESMGAILDDFERQILPAVTHWNHPHFHAYFAISASAPGMLGDFLSTALNANGMLWKSCPAATELEQLTLQWILQWLKLPASWFGMIQDSATSGALHAIVAARQRAEPESRQKGASGNLTLYVSGQTHSSVEKAAITAGIGQANVRHIGVDAEFRMRPDLLRAAIEEDLAAGRRPFFVAATVGTTSSNAIDPVDRIAEVCAEHDVWLHVDGAYGGSIGIVPEFRHYLKGVERADSFVVSPQKWLMVPIDCSLFYTRHPDVLRKAFSLEAEYLKTDHDEALNYSEYGLGLGRRFRALKLWFVLRYFGREGLAEILRGHVRLAHWLRDRIVEDGRLEMAAPVPMGLVCFRSKAGDAATRALMAEINGSGQFFVSHTVLAGTFAIRVAIGNIRTGAADIEALWECIRTAAA